jgi:hypothetical protein
MGMLKELHHLLFLATFLIQLLASISKVTYHMPHLHTQASSFKSDTGLVSRKISIQGVIFTSELLQHQHTADD